MKMFIYGKPRDYHTRQSFYGGYANMININNIVGLYTFVETETSIGRIVESEKYIAKVECGGNIFDFEIGEKDFNALLEREI